MRITLGAVAALACAFFVLCIHQSDALSAGAAVAAQPHPSAAAAARAAHDLRAAATLDPDRTVQITQAQLALARGEAGRARAILRRVVHDEPQNLDAWILLIRAAGGDRHLRSLAFAQALTLTHTTLH